MTKAHKHADVIHAWADGGTVQYKSQRGECEWKDDVYPVFDVNYEYRIKPEPKPDDVHHVRFIKLGEGTATFSWCSKGDASANARITFDGETAELKSVEILQARSV
jgi:hypothetical protein